MRRWYGTLSWSLFDTGVKMIKESAENKYFIHFLVGTKKKNEVEELDSIECKTRWISKIEEC